MGHNRGYKEKNKEKKTHKAKDTQLSTKVTEIRIREKIASSANGARQTLYPDREWN